MREETIPAEAFGTERSRRRSEVPDASAIFQSSDPGEGEVSAPEAANPPDPQQTPEVRIFGTVTYSFVDGSGWGG